MLPVVAPVVGAKSAVTLSAAVVRTAAMLSLNLKVVSIEVRQVFPPKSTELTVGTANSLRKEI